MVPAPVGSYQIAAQARENWFTNSPEFMLDLIEFPQIHTTLSQITMHVPLTLWGRAARLCLRQGYCFGFDTYGRDPAGTISFYEQWWDERDYGIDHNVFDMLALTDHSFAPALKRDFMMFKLAAELVNDRMFVIP